MNCYGIEISTQVEMRTYYCGQPVNFRYRAFPSKAERQAEQDRLWKEGKNLIFCTRKEIINDFGRDFYVNDTVVYASGEDFYRELEEQEQARIHEELYG